jgi:hypothetical protein
MKESLETVSGVNEEDFKNVAERLENQKQALRFIQSISNLAGNEIPILPITDPEYIPSAPGIYILPEYYQVEDPIVSAKFINDPKLLSGRVDSAHSVLAGTLVSITQSGERKEITVAAKCSLKREPEERHDRAVKELSIMSHLYKAGELAFKPIGLAITPIDYPMEGKLVMFSRFDPSINTMDNLPWGRGIDDPDNVESAIKAAESLGHLHSVFGFKHKDAKIKNCASGAIGSKTGYVDFETTEKINQETPYDAHDAALTDLEKLISSLRHKSFFNHPDAGKVLDEMLEAYLYQWANASNKVFTSVCEAIENVRTRAFE